VARLLVSSPHSPNPMVRLPRLSALTVERAASDRLGPIISGADRQGRACVRATSFQTLPQPVRPSHCWTRSLPRCLSPFPSRPLRSQALVAHSTLVQGVPQRRHFRRHTGRSRIKDGDSEVSAWGAPHFPLFRVDGAAHGSSVKKQSIPVWSTPLLPRDCQHDLTGGALHKVYVAMASACAWWSAQALPAQCW